MQHEIRANGTKTASVVVERDGREITLSPSTVVSPRLDPDNPERITKVGFLGVAPTTERERQGPGFVVTTMADGTWQTLQDDRLDAGEGLPRGPGRPRARGA